MAPPNTETAVSVETVTDEPRSVEGTVRELAVSDAPIPLAKARFVAETVEPARVDTVSIFPNIVLPASVENVKLLAAKLVARRVDAVAPEVAKESLFILEA